MGFENYETESEATAADLSGAALDRFVEENCAAIDAGSFDVIEQNLLADITRELKQAEKRGARFAKELARYLEEDLDGYRAELQTPDGGPDFRIAARNFLIAYQKRDEEFAADEAY